MLTADTLSTYVYFSGYGSGRASLLEVQSYSEKYNFVQHLICMTISLSTLTILFLCHTENNLCQDWFNTPLQDSICATNKETAGILPP